MRKFFTGKASFRGWATVWRDVIFAFKDKCIEENVGYPFAHSGDFTTAASRDMVTGILCKAMGYYNINGGDA